VNKNAIVSAVNMKTFSQSRHGWIMQLLANFVDNFRQIRGVWGKLPDPYVMEFDDCGMIVHSRTLRKTAEKKRGAVGFIFRDCAKYLDFYLKLKVKTLAGCTHEKCECQVQTFGQRQMLGFHYLGLLCEANWPDELCESINSYYEYDTRLFPSVRSKSKQLGRCDWALGGVKGKTGWCGYDVTGWETKPRSAKVAVFIDGVSQDVHFCGDGQWKDVDGGPDGPLRVWVPHGKEPSIVGMVHATTIEDNNNMRDSTAL